MDEPSDQISRDLEALARVPHRYAGTEGEREMLHQVRSRLPTPAGSGAGSEGRGGHSRIEGFVAYTSPGFVLGAHALALFVAGVLGLAWPLGAAVSCAAITLSLVAEGSGRYSVLRRVLPKSASYNLSWRRPATAPLGTLILTAPLDTPRWRPQRPRWLRRPMQLLLAAAIVVTIVITLRALAEPWGRPTQGMYVGSLGVLAAAVAVGAVAHRRAAGVEEDPSGPVALLELIRRFDDDPLPGVDLWAVFTGCGHAYQNGMHAFLAMRNGKLAEPALVVALSEPGRPDLSAVVAEGPLWSQHHRPTGPALVERLRWVGLDLKSARSPTITDARAAMIMGYRAIALAGGSGEATAANTLRAVEVAEAIGRLYSEDLRRVPDLHPQLRHLLPLPETTPTPSTPSTAPTTPATPTSTTGPTHPLGSTEPTGSPEPAPDRSVSLLQRRGALDTDRPGRPS